MNKCKPDNQKKQPTKRRFKRVKPISFLLKFCPPAPDIPEEALKERSWVISRGELDNG